VSLTQLAAQLRSGELSPREAVQSYLTRIEAAGELNAFISVRADEALAEAEHLPDGPLHGVPVAIKDVMVTRGVRSTAGSKILGNYIPPYDCTAVARMEAAGAIAQRL